MRIEKEPTVIDHQAIGLGTGLSFGAESQKGPGHARGRDRPEIDQRPLSLFLEDEVFFPLVSGSSFGAALEKSPEKSGFDSFSSPEAATSPAAGLGVDFFVPAAAGAVALLVVLVVVLGTFVLIAATRREAINSCTSSTKGIAKWLYSSPSPASV